MLLGAEEKELNKSLGASTSTAAAATKKPKLESEKPSPTKSERRTPRARDNVKDRKVRLANDLMCNFRFSRPVTEFCTKYM